MALVREMILNFLTNILHFFLAFRFGSIWRMKAYLKEAPGKHRIVEKVYNRYFEKRGSFWGYGCDMEDIPTFPHGLYGMFISHSAVIGKGCTIFHQVTVGSNTLGDSARRGAPVIGDNVYIGAGAKVIGKVKIGDGCRIGAGAVVVNDLPDNAVAVAQKVRVIQKDGLQNRYTPIGQFQRDTSQSM